MDTNSLFSAPASAGAATIGDFKHGFQIADHAGWIKLNGRLKSTLTVSQQAAATSLGIGANLPDVSDRAIVGASGTKAAQSSGGAATKTIAQANLPNVNLTSDTTGNHSHGVTDPGHTHNTSPVWYFAAGGTVRIGTGGIYGAEAPGNIVAATTGISINNNGAHAHTVPLGGSNSPLDVQNPYLALNGFVYLGA